MKGKLEPGNNSNYNIGDHITTKNGGYTIIDMYKKNIEQNGKMLKILMFLCKCDIDGYEFERRKHEIDRREGCPICTHKKAVLGYNTIYDLRPDLIQYFENIDDAKKYAVYSNKKVWLVCPKCKNRKYMEICRLSSDGFFCQYCSDGLTYPNKFVREFLNQLNVNYDPEHKFSWSPAYWYDEYIDDKKIIIENHGEQHYEKDHNWYRDNDEIKKELALQNGILYYVVLDCRESSMTYIKRSIMESDLPKLLNFKESDIDWCKCELFASDSLLLTVCDLWNKQKTYKEIEIELKLCYDTVLRYIRKGKAIGLVENKRRHGDIYFGTKPIYCVDDDLYFFSAKFVEDYYNKNTDTKIYRRRLLTAIRLNKPYKKKKFVNITFEEYNNAKKYSDQNNTTNVIGGYYPDEYLLSKND